jgi:carboxyl-terminal processing protease
MLGSMRILALRPFPLALVLSFALAGSQARAEDAALTCNEMPRLMSQYLQHHVLHHQLDEPLRGRVVDQYLERIDGARSLYLDPEAKKLMAGLRDGLDDILGGDCARLETIQRDVVQRTRQLEEFVRGEMAKPEFALDPATRLLGDPRKRGFPKTPTDRDGLYRALIQFQIANYLNSGLSMDEARKQLVHRYELATKQTAEQENSDLRAAFLDSFASALDPHSNYLAPDEAEDFDITMGLSLEGIGLSLSSRDGYAVVEEVITGGAADRHGGVKRKDKIVAVTQDGAETVKVIDMKLRDVVRMIRGPKGTPVQLTMLRPGDPPERFSVTIVRDKIDLEEQAAKLRYESIERDGKTLKLAILELPGFYGDRDPAKRQAERDVKDILQKVRNEKADGLLLDLSRNGGGLLEYAISISGFFVLDGGIVAVKQESVPPRVLADPDQGILYAGPMVVLISRATASASEILAGALQDYRRAVVVGDDQTFGKGTVQSVINLGDDLGKLKVTTALFFRPGGASTQLAGVKSDVALPSYSNTDEVGEKALPGALPAQNIPAFVPTTEPLLSPWQPVTPNVVALLQQKATGRVAASTEFSEIREKLAEAKQNAGMVILADVMKTKDKGDEDPDEAEARGPNRKLTPQALEATQILADYVVLQRQQLAQNGPK